MNNIETLINEIPLELAKRAYSGISFEPEKRAHAVRTSYATQLVADYENLRQVAERNETLNLFEEAFARYHAGYLKRFKAWLGSKSRCVSFMISGPSNFPVARQEKINRIEGKRLDELCEYRKHVFGKIEKELCPTARNIYDGDADAVARLEAELVREKAAHELGKSVNVLLKATRGEPDGIRLQKLVDSGVTPERAIHYLRDGYLACSGANATARIRKLEQRIAHLKQKKSLPSSTFHGENARIEDCPAENRVRLFFPGKPDADARNELKKNGFRWSPSLGCWQAYHRHQNRVFALKIAGKKIAEAQA
jgi:hypothetical protein